MAKKEKPREKKQVVATPLFCVGIGASAGGLEAIERFFKRLSPNSGMAFVLVQHLSPDYKSLMGELLAKYTSMPIFRAEDGMPLQADHIFLIPPKKSMTLFGRRIYLSDHDPRTGLNLPIDIFFRSLAQDMGKHAIGIILSGTGSDGALGIRAIKEEGGMVLVQDDISAKFDGMPRSAIATGMVDFVLSPDEMPAKLLGLIKHPHISRPPIISEDLSSDTSLLKILKIIRDKTGTDFTYYKPNTILRRLDKRLGINQIDDYGGYLGYLGSNPEEVMALYKDLLIGVTQFFRDNEAFTLIENTLLPEILARKNKGDIVRVWSVGCSTGEEVYSLAMLFSEYMDAHDTYFDLKLFATDIDQDHIEIASTGYYPESIVADVSPSRLEAFFSRKDNGYLVNERLRRMVIFARHNIIKDPPFSKIDLICCRNMLIYLNVDIQRKILSVFYYSLLPGGGLFLGSSETLGDLAEGFETLNNKWKIYRQKVGYKSHYQANYLLPLSQLPKVTPRPTVFNVLEPEEKKLPENILGDLLEAVMPPAVIVNEKFTILHVFNQVSDIIQLSPGKAHFDILSMVPKQVSVILSSMLHTAFNEGKHLIFKDIKIQGTDYSCDISAKPITDKLTKRKFALVLFEKTQNRGAIIDGETETVSSIDAQISRRLIEAEKELQFTRENLQATIEELETSNEELQSTNEELVASNEELQSTNEELQSVNEELFTVNAEYQKKIEELTESNNDMNNLLRNSNIGILFLDRHLRIRKFTNLITRMVNILEMDIGRPIHHISLNLNYQSFISDIEHVRNTLKIKEIEIEDAEGKWNLVKIQPYRTFDNAVDGIAVTIVDISALKASEERCNELRECLDSERVEHEKSLKRRAKRNIKEKT